MFGAASWAPQWYGLRWHSHKAKSYIGVDTNYKSLAANPCRKYFISAQLFNSDAAEWLGQNSIGDGDAILMIHSLHHIELRPLLSLFRRYVSSGCYIEIHDPVLFDVQNAQDHFALTAKLAANGKQTKPLTDRKFDLLSPEFACELQHEFCKTAYGQKHIYSDFEQQKLTSTSELLDSLRDFGYGLFSVEHFSVVSIGIRRQD